MNTLSLDDAYGGSIDETEPPKPAPTPPPQRAPQRAPQPPPQPQYQPQLHPQLQTEYPRRRQVRFNDEPRKRFARVDGGVAVNSSNWMERNKPIVTGVTVAVILILIAVLVMVCRKQPKPLAGGGVPAYVGGPGWDESVSQFAYY
jgi:hypothetical protein